jgi:hypothetical protein
MLDPGSWNHQGEVGFFSAYFLSGSYNNQIATGQGLAEADLLYLQQQLQTRRRRCQGYCICRSYLYFIVFVKMYLKCTIYLYLIKLLNYLKSCICNIFGTIIIAEASGTDYLAFKSVRS